MMSTTELHWIEGPWPGRLAVAARPRGGDWLEDEIAAWRREGVKNVVSLLTPDEESDLDLTAEARIVAEHGMDFLSLPIADRSVPGSDSELSAALQQLETDLRAGKNVVVHCRQGIGRSGLVAACLLISKGTTPERALRQVSSARGVAVPETKEQRDWIDRYAAALAAAK